MTKKSAWTARRPPLDERFEFLGEDPRAHGEGRMLRGMVFPVYDRVAETERCLRVWRKTGTAIDADLRELWLHEMRQVRRLMATAGADVIVDILELVEDDREFGIVIADCGSSLALVKARANPGHWLQNLQGGRSRALLWENVRRLAQALSLVHGQGLVHGTLSADAVMTRGGQDPDFRLTGFEWSMWFAAPPGKLPRPDTSAATARQQQAAYSFAADWRALGELVAALLSMAVSPNGEVRPSKASLNVDLSVPELMLLRKLLRPRAAEVLDAAAVMRSIDDIVADITRAGAVRNGTFLVLVKEGSGLPQAVAKATDGAIELDQGREQIAWAAADLSGGATVLTLPTMPERLRLVTETMAYELQASTSDSGEASWDIAICESASLREDERVRDTRGAAHEIAQPVSFFRSRREATETRARLGRTVLDWGIFAGPPQPASRSRSVEVRQALILVQAVEAFAKTLEVLPVEVVRSERERGRRIVTLQARSADRDAVALVLGLGTTEAAMRRLFEEDGRQGDGTWVVGTSGALDGSRTDVNATFLDISDPAGVAGYRFELDDDPPSGQRLFLRSKKETGTGAVVRRRLRNIAAMADHAAVADLLDDPWLVLRHSRDILKEDERFKNLDSSKQEALRGFWSTLPLFAVIGPPGVGKTYLAQEVVRRRFECESASRLLLTAQGHQALNHLQAEVMKALATSGNHDPLVIRTASAKRTDRSGSDLEEGDEPEIDATRVKVTEMLETLSASSLAEAFPPPFRDRLAESARNARAESSDPEQRRGYRATADLLLDAANVVVSTMNSEPIGRLVAGRANFDAVIIEEAAKATGPELVGPLALSGRHLLIGDHNQLPPFDADRLSAILANADLCRKVVDSAPEQLGGWLREEDMSELRDATTDAQRLERLTQTARRMVEPFRSLIERDEARTAGRVRPRRISAVLSLQRRMHPAISEIVSKAFYRGKLGDVVKVPSAAPFECLEPLPSSPVVVVDFPHVNRTGLAEPAEYRLRGFHNPKEIDAVFRVLRFLRPADQIPAPTLAILSPYGEQVRQIGSRLRHERDSGLLRHLDGFRPVRDAVGFVGTVDSFQGSEADVVIVSMVRNNPRAGRSGLGFLSDPRRMNVLLSRAKSKLVIVTSLRFLKEAVRGNDPGGSGGDLEFLRKVDSVLQSLRTRTSPDGTPLASVVSPSSLAVPE